MNVVADAVLRPMSADEGEALKYGEPVTVREVATGEVYSGSVKSFNDEGVTVRLRSGAVLWFDLDSPDYWGDHELMRDRQSPTTQDGAYVLVTSEPSELFNAIKASIELEALRGQVKKLTDKVQGMPTRDEYDALHADCLLLHEEIEVLRSLLKPRAA